MFNWIKNLFGNPKTLIKIGVDSLDSFVDNLADLIEEAKKTAGWLTWTSKQQAQWIIDRTQEYAYKLFKL